MIFHKHHLIPKYAGGDNSPDNLVRVNIAMHAFLHSLRYVEKGDIRDLKAAEGLLKIKPRQEIIKELSLLTKRFSGKTHTKDTKTIIASSMVEVWKTRDKNQITDLGKSDHKRNPHPGQVASCLTGHPHKRKHWDENLFNEVRDAYLGRTSFHWGRKELCEKYGVTIRTIENMVKNIRQGKTFIELTQKFEGV
jgi:hypothetical protein